MQVVRRLWDSWEDDAEIRDAATGRFIDRDKLHYIDFHGRHFSIKGPSIVPRPPQGQPVVTALAHSAVPYRFAARNADVVFVTPVDAADATRIVDEIRREQAAAGRADEPSTCSPIWWCSWTPPASPDRIAGPDWIGLDGTDYNSDARIFAGSAGRLADLLVSWQQAGITGYRLRPGGAAGRPRLHHRRSGAGTAVPRPFSHRL